MKFSIIIAALSAAIVLASPAAVSLERKTRSISINGEATAFEVPCVECPCDGWDAKSCRCITNGCCC